MLAPVTRGGFVSNMVTPLWVYAWWSSVSAVIPSICWEEAAARYRFVKEDYVKLGDKAKVLCSDEHRQPESRNGEVVRVLCKNMLCPTHLCCYRVRFADGAECYYNANALRKITEEDNTTKKETTMSKSERHYRVVKDTPMWKKGAILEKEGTEYKAINDLWDQIDDISGYVEGEKVVENSDFFERVYAMGKASKLMYVTREKAQEMASKFFSGE